MSKKTKIEIIAGSAAIWLTFDLALIISGTRGQTVNAYWAAGLALLAVLYGLIGLMMAKKWSWLKSHVGKAVASISLGNIMWGIGQAGWTFYLFKYPSQEYQAARILDVLFFSSIPLWFYGILKLTKASGAKYGLKKTTGKILVVLLIVLMTIFAYYILVVVARGGTAYFEQPLWEKFFDLGYSIGDTIILTIALAIFGLSWRYLGGRFKKPILTVLAGFGLMYVADFVFSYVSGKGTYYNGDISDILFLIALTVLSAALCLLDPSKKAAKSSVQEAKEAYSPYTDTPQHTNPNDAKTLLELEQEYAPHRHERKDS